MKKIGMVLGAGLMALSFFACGQDNSRLQEKAAIEGAAAAKEQVAVENSAREERIKKLENQLINQRRFIEAVTGDFTSQFSTSDGDAYTIKLSVMPSYSLFIPPEGFRTEGQVEREIERTLIDVTSNIEVSGLGSINICDYLNVTPDLQGGFLQLKAPSCAKLSLAVNTGPNDSESSGKLKAAKLAGDILNGTVAKIDLLEGTIRLPRFSEQISLTLTRAK